MRTGSNPQDINRFKAIWVNMLFVIYLKFFRMTANNDTFSLTGALAASLGTSLSVAGIDQTTIGATGQAEDFQSK